MTINRFVKLGDPDAREVHKLHRAAIAALYGDLLAGPRAVDFSACPLATFAASRKQARRGPLPGQAESPNPKAKRKRNNARRQ